MTMIFEDGISVDKLVAKDLDDALKNHELMIDKYKKLSSK